MCLQLHHSVLCFTGPISPACLPSVHLQTVFIGDLIHHWHQKTHSGISNNPWMYWKNIKVSFVSVMILYSSWTWSYHDKNNVIASLFQWWAKGHFVYTVDYFILHLLFLANVLQDCGISEVISDSTHRVKFCFCSTTMEFK